ncbi:hypothetical protein KI387_005572, partial [Taxus chinensis]
RVGPTSIRSWGTSPTGHGWHGPGTWRRERETRYYQDVLDGTSADYHPYAAHRAETCWSHRSQGAVAIAGG